MECLVFHLFDFFYLIYRQIHHDSQSQIGGFKRQGDNMADAKVFSQGTLNLQPRVSYVPVCYRIILWNLHILQSKQAN
jgi:hypothetical protein